MMDRNTGQALGPGAHLRQSIAEILSTPIGSRVMRRDFGSLLPALIDQPGNAATAARLASAAASALMRWEPRIGLLRITPATEPDAGGQPITGIVALNIEATLADASGRASPIAMTVTVGAA